ncbi:hypothetical protein AB870_19840 [Pandoraea faecigallinarum]|uniref:Uncharacterized protein n=1 Tax=Pandoraea faecigallinarum TaxID=656179 RepID=A0A0H3WXY8_9BURK|nr:DUF1178 family protein [Pandoraea faecigallinarum]AKM33039.1 hypothetical protein AB870_19840 [Pandoraea faecigallinarum]
MKVFDLRCAHEHTFEGWFGSEDDFLSQQQRALVTCPVCGDAGVVRLPSAPRLNLSGAKDASPPQSALSSASSAVPSPASASAARAGVPPAVLEARREMQALWMKAVRHVMANTEDVGNHFAEEARKIHYKEAPERNIRGIATPQETAELAEEGIDVMMLPVPAAAKETLQ